MHAKLLLTGIYFFIFTINSFTQSYHISIKNGVFVNDYNYEFDVIIKSTDENFELTSYQISLVYFLSVRHELSFSYINETSDLEIYPSAGIGVFANSNGQKVLTFGSFPGSEIIGESEKRIGRFKLTSNKSLKERNNFIYWNFNGIIITILTGAGFNNITNPANHFPSAEIYRFDIEQDDIELLQNYPNPFNPLTTIKYKIPSESFVQLKIFNVLGEELKTLVNEFHLPGFYEVKFNAGSLPSGYYIYSLYSNNNVIENKKMILVK